MGWFEFLWSDEPDGNVEHLAQHGLTMDDFEHVFDHAESEWLEEDMTVLPITAYEV